MILNKKFLLQLSILHFSMIGSAIGGFNAAKNILTFKVAPYDLGKTLDVLQTAKQWKNMIKSPALENLKNGKALVYSEDGLRMDVLYKIQNKNIEISNLPIPTIETTGVTNRKISLVKKNDPSDWFSREAHPIEINVVQKGTNKNEMQVEVSSILNTRDRKVVDKVEYQQIVNKNGSSSFEKYTYVNTTNPENSFHIGNEGNNIVIFTEKKKLKMKSKESSPVLAKVDDSVGSVQKLVLSSSGEGGLTIRNIQHKIGIDGSSSIRLELQQADGININYDFRVEKPNRRIVNSNNNTPADITEVRGSL